MGKFNRQEQLKQLHAERKVKTEQKVSKAINELVRKMKKLTLILLLSIQMYLKLLLYNNSKIRKRIEELREQSKDIFVHKNNSDGKDALISSLKRRVKSLENEKKRLKDEINTLYNKIYEDI